MDGDGSVSYFIVSLDHPESHTLSPSWQIIKFLSNHVSSDFLPPVPFTLQLITQHMQVIHCIMFYFDCTLPHVCIYMYAIPLRSAVRQSFYIRFNQLIKLRF